MRDPDRLTAPVVVTDRAVEAEVLGVIESVVMLFPVRFEDIYTIPSGGKKVG
jgi:hypothetical protein